MARTKTVVDNSLPVGYKSLYTLLCEGPKTTAELAASLGEPPMNIANKISRLWKCGLIAKTKTYVPRPPTGSRGAYVRFSAANPDIIFRDPKEQQRRIAELSNERRKREMSNDIARVVDAHGCFRIVTVGKTLGVTRQRAEQLCKQWVAKGLCSRIPQHFEVAKNFLDSEASEA